MMFFCSKIPQNAHNPGYGKAEPYIIQGKWQFQLSAFYNIMGFFLKKEITLTEINSH